MFITEDDHKVQREYNKRLSKMLDILDGQMESQMQPNDNIIATAPPITQFFSKNLLDSYQEFDAHKLYVQFLKATDNFDRKPMSDRQRKKYRNLVSEFMRLYEIAIKKENQGCKISYLSKGPFYRPRIVCKRHADVYNGFTSSWHRQQIVAKRRKYN